VRPCGGLADVSVLRFPQGLDGPSELHGKNGGLSGAFAAFSVRCRPPTRIPSSCRCLETCGSYPPSDESVSNVPAHLDAAELSSGPFRSKGSGGWRSSRMPNGGLLRRKAAACHVEGSRPYAVVGGARPARAGARETYRSVKCCATHRDPQSRRDAACRTR